MSYPGPPGVSSNTSHPSLPPRPPPSKSASGFKPAFSPAVPPVRTTGAPPAYSAIPTTSYPSAPGYGAAAAPSPASYGAPATPALGGARGGYGQTNTYGYQQPHAGYGQQPTYYGAATNSYSTPPQIRNPFPVPQTNNYQHVPAAAGAATGDYDPEYAAQVAQWQSAYMPKDPNDPANRAAAAGARMGPGASMPGAAQMGPGGYGVSGIEAADGNNAANGAAGAAATHDNGPKKTVLREGGGKVWKDDTLLEWDPNGLRLFVGNLAGETTDESLLKAFSRWKSVQKAKVVRDKRTSKSKGYGFVSLSDPDEFYQAAKEMNGKYIQSHPVVVRKAKTEVKPVVVKDDRRNGKHKNKNNKKSGNGMGGGGGGGGSGAGHADGTATSYEPHLGPVGGGVTKPGQKTRGGLKLLG